MKENKIDPLLILLTITVLFAGVLIGTLIGRLTAPINVDNQVNLPPAETLPPYTLPYQTNQTGKINVNVATAEELALLPGIGAETAKRIIEYRTKYGIFETLEEMTKVKGVGEGTIDKIRPYATVGG